MLASRLDALKSGGSGVTETVFNVFLDFENHRCVQARYVAHDVSLDDAQAIEFLRQRVEADLPNAKVAPLKAAFTKAQYDAHCRLGRGIELYDDVFADADAGPQPLFVVTAVVDGAIVVDLTGHIDEFNSFLTPKVLGGGQMRDWLTYYSTEAGLDIPALIHDDYFLAIKLTYNASLYASSAKLLLSCIDSLAFIEFGHTNESAFVLWLKAYADLSLLAITPEELWELRNGLLHMTNLSSRKVAAQKVRRISFRVGGDGGSEEDGIYYLPLMDLVEAFTRATESWLRTYNDDRSKLPVFVERYDETVSDSRILQRPTSSAR